MFGWLQDLLRSIVDAITGGFASAAKAISDSIWNAMMRWLYNSVYSAIADFFTMMGNMGAEIFDLAWIRAIVQLFTLVGWGLFVAGAVVAIFDLAVEYQSGRANIKNTLLNILKGFFACSLIGLVPIELYKFCISLQNTFAGELARIFSRERTVGICPFRYQVEMVDCVSPAWTARSYSDQLRAVRSLVISCKISFIWAHLSNVVTYIILRKKLDF